MAQMINVTGRCHCGAISIEAAIEETRMVACHCLIVAVQRRAFPPVVIANGANVRLEGQPRSMPRRRIAVTPACRDSVVIAARSSMPPTPRKQPTYSHRLAGPARQSGSQNSCFGNSSPDWLTGIADHNWLSQGPGSDAYNPIRRI